MNRLAAILVIFVLTAGNLSAQGLGFGGGPHVGIAFSSFKKPAGDLYGMGLLFGGHGEMNIGKYVAVRLSFDYSTYGSDKEKLKGFIGDAVVKTVEEFVGRPLVAQEITGVKGTVRSADGGRVSAPAILVTGLGKIPTGSMVVPYGLLGFGVTFLGFGDISFESTGVSTNQGQVIIPAGNNSSKIDSETKFGMHFGAGSEFKLSNLVKLYFEAKYSMIFTSDGTSSYFPIVVGATFGG